VSDTASFGYGPGGATIQSVTANLSRRVRFQTPRQVGDQIIVEVSEDGIKWSAINVPVTNSGVTYTVSPFVTQNGTTYGVGRVTPVSNTDVDVWFGQYAESSSTYGSTGRAWSTGGSSWYWRVRKSSAGAAVGFGIVSSQSAGLLPATNANLDDATATRLGLKQYLHGTTYNGGNAPTITCSQAGFAVVRGVFIPYQTQDGAWRLKFNMVGTFTSATLTGIIFVVAGITIKNTTNFFQGISATPYSGLAAIYQQYVNPNTANFNCSFASSSQAGCIFSGDIELDSKPTWAY
jgi:hypothetical protein